MITFAVPMGERAKRVKVGGKRGRHGTLNSVICGIENLLMMLSEVFCIVVQLWCISILQNRGEVCGIIRSRGKPMQGCGRQNTQVWYLGTAGTPGCDVSNVPDCNIAQRCPTKIVDNQDGKSSCSNMYIDFDRIIKGEQASTLMDIPKALTFTMNGITYTAHDVKSGMTNLCFLFQLQHATIREPAGGRDDQERHAGADCVGGPGLQGGTWRSSGRFLLGSYVWYCRLGHDVVRSLPSVSSGSSGRSAESGPFRGAASTWYILCDTRCCVCVRKRGGVSLNMGIAKDLFAIQLSVNEWGMAGYDLSDTDGLCIAQHCPTITVYDHHARRTSTYMNVNIIICGEKVSMRRVAHTLRCNMNFASLGVNFVCSVFVVRMSWTNLCLFQLQYTATREPAGEQDGRMRRVGAEDAVGPELRDGALRGSGRSPPSSYVWFCGRGHGVVRSPTAPPLGRLKMRASYGPVCETARRWLFLYDVPHWVSVWQYFVGFFTTEMATRWQFRRNMLIVVRAIYMLCGIRLYGSVGVLIFQYSWKPPRPVSYYMHQYDRILQAVEDITRLLLLKLLYDLPVYSVRTYTYSIYIRFGKSEPVTAHVYWQSGGPYHNTPDKPVAARMLRLAKRRICKHTHRERNTKTTHLEMASPARTPDGTSVICIKRLYDFAIFMQFCEGYGFCDSTEGKSVSKKGIKSPVLGTVISCVLVYVTHRTSCLAKTHSK